MKNNGRNSVVTTPLIIYILIISVSIVFIILGLCIPSYYPAINNVLLNLGYGIFASCLVAFLIDISNTIKSRNIANMQAEELLSDFNKAFLDLRDSVINVAEEIYLADEKKRTFDEWLNYIYDSMTEEMAEECQDGLFGLYFAIQKIGDVSQKTYNVLLNHFDNETISKELRRDIKYIPVLTHCINFRLDEGNWIIAKRIITQKLVPKYLKHYESNRPLFEVPYNTDRNSSEDE